MILIKNLYINFYLFFLKFNLIFFNLNNNKYKKQLKFCLNFSYQFKYSWSSFENDFLRFFEINTNDLYNLEFTQFNNNILLNIANKFNILNNIILFKKQSIFFKKSTNKNLFILNFLDSFKYEDQPHFTNLENNEYKNNLYSNKNYFYNLEFIDFNQNFNKDIEYQSFDYRYKINRYVNDNRSMILSFFKFNLKRKYKKNKFFSKLIKLPFKYFLNNFEFSLSNILLRSSFFFNQRDIIFFLKNNFFFINGGALNNYNYVFNINDIFILSFNKYYFFYYRYTINNIYNNNKISNYIFKKNQNNNISRIPLWLINTSFIKEDLPNYLEIDFLSLSLKIIYKPFFYNEYNFIFFKLLNFYQKRLYNWKNVI
jgi:hypothetical protein